VCCRLSELKREIGAQTGTQQSDLIVVHRTLTLGSEAETETVGDLFPATSEEFPVVLSSASMATWRDVTRMKPTLREFDCAMLTYSWVARTERQSARMSKITNDYLTRSGTGCFIG